MYGYRSHGDFPPGVTGNEPEITGRSPEQKLTTVYPKNSEKYKTRFVANAELVEDNGLRAGQRYQLDRRTYEPNPMSDTVLLCGINHNPRAKIGDKGIIVYCTTPSSGLMYFWNGWTEDRFNEEYGE